MRENRNQFKQIIGQAIPTFFSQQLVNANSILDTIMIGHISMIQLASLGIAVNIYNTLYIPFMGILLGLIPLIAQANGSGNFIKVASLIRQGGILSIILSFVAILFLFFPNLFLALAHSSKNIDSIVKSYLIVIAIGMPSVLLFRVYFAFYSAILKPQIIVYINLAMLIIKIMVNFVIIYHVLPAGLNVLGCAISTSTVSWLAVIVSYIIVKKNPEFKHPLASHKLEWINFKEQVEILKIGIPIGITFIIDYTFFTITGLFIARLGAVNAAANQIVGNLCYMIYLVPFSISTAASALVARQLGANNLNEAHKIGISSLKVGGLISLVLSLIFITFNKFLVSIYTTDMNILLLASALLILVGIYHFLDAILTIIGGILRGYKKTFVPTIIFAGTLWPIGLGGGYYLAFLGNINYLRGAYGFWLALIISVTVAGVLMTIYYRLVATKHKREETITQLKVA